MAAEIVIPALDGCPVQREGGIVPECEDATPGIANVRKVYVQLAKAVDDTLG